MASITATWDNTTPAAGDNAGGGDDRIREAKTATRERAQNAGLYWPDASASLDSGAPFISPDARVANEFNVFDKTAGGVPDVARKLLTLTQTTLVTHSAVAVNVAGTLSEAGSRVVAKSGSKRTVVLNVTGAAAQNSSDQPVMGDCLLYVPLFNSGQVALTGTIREFSVIRKSNTAPTNGTTFDLLKAGTAAWVTNEITTLTFVSVLAASLVLATSKYAIRTSGAASFAGAAFPTVVGGDILQVLPANPGTNFIVSAQVVIDFDWP